MAMIEKCDICGAESELTYSGKTLQPITLHLDGTTHYFGEVCNKCYAAARDIDWKALIVEQIVFEKEAKENRGI